MLDKGEGTAPEKQRLIRLISVIQAAYSRARYDTSRQWQKEVFPIGICGGRRRLGCADLSLPTAMEFEANARRGTPSMALSVDKRKCFDMFQAEINTSLYEALGGDPAVAGAYRRYYDSEINGTPETHLLVGRWVAEPFDQSNSMVQGDVWSILACNTLFAVLLMRLKRRHPGVTANSM